MTAEPDEQLLGPNHMQVRRVADAIMSLSDSAWERVAEAKLASEAAYGSFSSGDFELLVRGDENRWDQINSAMRLAIDFLAGGGRAGALRFDVAGYALAAVAAADLIAEPQFAAAYGPFASVIPIWDISEKLPEVPPPPDEPERRLILRFRALSEQDWDSAITIAGERDVAVGADIVNAAHNRAYDILNQLGSEEPSWLADLEQFFATGGPFAGTAGVWDTLGHWLGKTEYWSAAQYSARMADREQAARMIAIQGAFAVAANEVNGALGDQQVALLYLPFSWRIPLASLYG